jgi:subtilisin family serine protease
MRQKDQNFIVQVLDSDSQAIRDARVVLKSGSEEFRLEYDNDKGFYTWKREVPKGEYLLTVSRKPFEDDSRKIIVRGSGPGGQRGPGERSWQSEQRELFILRKKGVPWYYRGKVKVPYEPDEERLALVIPGQPEPPRKGRAKQKPQTPGREQMARSIAGKFKLKLEEHHEIYLENGIFITSFPKGLSKSEKLKIFAEIEKEEKVMALPVLKLTDRHATLLTSEIMVRLDEHAGEEAIQNIAKEFGLKIKRRISVLGNFYHLTTGKTPTYEVIEISNKISEMEWVEFAEPNVVFTVEEDAITPTDFLFPEQWDHQILNTPDAWQFLRNIDVNRTFGRANVIIAVVDSGVDPNNPEFTGNVNNGTSKIYRSFDFENMVANNNSRSSGHGTSCASAASALTNNASAVAGINEGVAGVAGNCRILAIRRAWPGSEAGYADMYLWAAGFDPESDDDDFPNPISPGADVISNSIGHPATGSAISGTMTAVFDTLTDSGRGGRGVLLFFSAGNNNNNNDTAFDRPWGMYERCFSIAASSLGNDGVTEVRANYSNFGSATEFCAPSHDAYVGGAPLHNPPANYGTFAATDTDSPEGHGTVGRPTVQTTLSANANAGANTVTVNNVAGMATGQSLMLRNPGSGVTEAHIINAINNATSVVTLNRNLFNNHPNGTNVFATAHDYRSNFGGTSHSTPLCAGTAALMLSANPQLTWTQVRDIMRNTAVRINPGETNANGRWQDINGNPSNVPAYDGTPVFSNFYGFGRIDTAVAVRIAGWDIEMVTTNLDFNDVPEGETTARAIRFNVKSLWPANFTMTPPGGPFGTPFGLSQSIGPSPDANLVREVYLWVTFTGTSEGDTITMADGFSVTVSNPETEQEWNIPITANTIKRETAAVMLSLDQSGSMDFPSGIGSSKRIDVLRFSANILVDIIQEGNGLGIVSFDHDAHDVLSFTGPLGPSTPFDTDRATIKAAIAGFDPNPGGLTSIGNGIERAQLRLNPVSGYHSKSIIVFTDGKENRPKLIEEVEDLINDRVFAIGLGKAQNISPAALNAITNNSGGYLLLTDELDEDSIFKLAKYFLQILAGVNNEEVVVDPDGKLFAGQEHRIPFTLNEADISSDIILMLPGPHLIDFFLETPNGHLLSASDNTTMPGLTYSYGNNVAFYRLTLPLPLGAGEREGKWHAILRINEKYHRELKYHAGMTVSHESTAPAAAFSGGVPYTLLVHAWSGVKMKALLTQTHYEPGAELNLNVMLTQYGIPLASVAAVTAELTSPAGSKTTLSFTMTGPGEYAAKVTTVQSGIYRFLIKSSGTTIRGRSFTRELVRTAAVWEGGNRPPVITPGDRPGGFGKEDLCRLLSCLFGGKAFTREFRERMRRQGIEIDSIIECLTRYCREQGKAPLSGEELTRLKLQYDQLLDIYDRLIKGCG